MIKRQVLKEKNCYIEKSENSKEKLKRMQKKEFKNTCRVKRKDFEYEYTQRKQLLKL